MPTTIKKTTALIVSSVEKVMSDSSASRRFMELVKACDIDAEVVNQLPELNKIKVADCVLIDLNHISLKSHQIERVLAFTHSVDVVFFNAEEQYICEPSALLAGVKGIFYRDDRSDLILKGLESIIKKECWFKRSSMNKAVDELLKMQPKNQATFNHTNTGSDLPRLTRREQTIVRLVSSGAQNKEIAEQLHISPNTVKTHIYSLFRKTSSRNRIELITWSQQFNPTQLLSG